MPPAGVFVTEKKQGGTPLSSWRNYLGGIVAPLVRAPSGDGDGAHFCCVSKGRERPALSRGTW